MAMEICTSDAINALLGKGVAKEFGIETISPSEMEGCDFDRWRGTKETRRLLGWICEKIAGTRLKRDALKAGLAHIDAIPATDDEKIAVRQKLAEMEAQLDVLCAVVEAAAKQPPP